MPDAHPIQRLNEALEGRYRIERELGEGGMATVYLAQDERHHRQVALKVLKPELAAVVGADRFLGEIQTTANLQHPHILPLFDSGEAEGFLYYVMPYVEGESLRDRLERENELPIDEAIRIAAEVAEALDHAHRRGFVHRDVKPGNILLQDGRPVVTDFGIALAISAAGEGRLTETGLSVGTPYYMSPEQASGDRTVGPRSDIYALSCVLYEMFTGEPPYTGSTAQAVLGRILMGEPIRPSEHRKTVPERVERVVLRGLAKVPADRFSSAADFARALKDAARGSADSVPRRDPAQEEATRQSRVPLLAGGVGVVLVGAVAWSLFAAQTDVPEVARQRVVLGSGIERITGAVGLRTALAPDGSGVLFSDTAGTFWWKPRGEADAVPMPNLRGAVSVVFSPDAEWIAYVADGELRRQPLRGGTTQSLVDSISWGSAHAIAWLDDGTIVFENTNYVLQTMPEDGREPPRTVTTVDDTGYPLHASGMPGGGAFLVTACPSSTCSTSHLSLVEYPEGTVTRLANDVARAWSVLDDRILYVDRGGTVLVATFDRDERRLGSGAPLFDGVRGDLFFSEMQMGADGTVLYVRGRGAADEYEPVWVDREGQAERVDPEWGTGRMAALALSPDGDRVAVSVAGDVGEDIWVKELPAGPISRLTSNGGRPVWTPDGRFLAYITNEGGREHARRLPVDGSSSVPDTVLLRERPVWEVIFADLGLLFREGTIGGGAADLRLIPEGETTAVEILASEFDEKSMAMSPDGGWLAYVSNASGEEQVFVRPFPEASARRIQISVNGGSEPRWAHGGREVFYRDRDGWMVATTVTTQPSFSVESRTRLFDARSFRAENNWRAYDVAPDDRRFLMLRMAGIPEGDPGAGELIRIENFLAEVEASSSN